MQSIIYLVRDNWQQILTIALDIVFCILFILYDKRFGSKTNLLKGIVKDSITDTVERIEKLQKQNDELTEKNKKMLIECRDKCERLEKFCEFLSGEEEVEDGRFYSTDTGET